MRELLRTGDPVRLSWAVATLEDAGIESYVLDTHVRAVEGGIGAFPSRLAVRDEDFVRAERILRIAEAEIQRDE